MFDCHITEILAGKRGVTPDTALRLAVYFGNSPRFWLNLQTAHDLAQAEKTMGDQVRAEVMPA
jgi:addiction module HigA family antidote